ncbi:hypothetical protein [Eubacterium callanderi]|uniref:hypothetical protein n=1 Tax=Eubacterium callanderi TaxID=53442 RepID=UPI001C0FB0ED|nr:hypothetical protein [Eubacterium callanderi]MBU5303705.1 hypothetical protein [Eubacterium callanderi]
MHLKDIPRLILGFLLVVMFMGFQTLVFVDAVALNPMSYYSYLEDPAYFSRLKGAVDTGMGDIARYTNIPEEALLTGYTDSELSDFSKSAVRQFLEYLGGKTDTLTISFDDKILKSNVENAVRSYAGGAGISYNATLSAQVEDITKIAVDAVNSYSMIIDPNLLMQTGIPQKLAEILSYLRMTEVGLAVGALLFVLCLWLTNRKHPMRVLWWSGAALFVSSLTLILPAAVLRITNLASKFGTKETYIKWIAQTICNSFFDKWMMIQFVFLVVGVLMMIYYVFWRKRKKQRVKAHFNQNEKNLI